MIFETAFDIGQTVYFLYDGKITKGVIRSISLTLFSDTTDPYNTEYEIEYKKGINGNGGTGKLMVKETEHNLFKSPEELTFHMLESFEDNYKN